MIATAVIGAVGAVVAAVLGGVNHRKIMQVHVLVNSRLDQALAKLADLESKKKDEPK